jgi:RNA processing factor Prp31
MFDAKMVADEMGLMVKSYVEKTTAPLLAQISALQAKVDAIPSPVSSEEVRDLVEGRIKSLDFPEPQKGEKATTEKASTLTMSDQCSRQK